MNANCNGFRELVVGWSVYAVTIGNNIHHRNHTTADNAGADGFIRVWELDAARGKGVLCG